MTKRPNQMRLCSTPAAGGTLASRRPDRDCLGLWGRLFLFTPQWLGLRLGRLSPVPLSMGPPLAWVRPSWNRTWLAVGVRPRAPWATWLEVRITSLVTVVSFISVNGELSGFSFLFFFTLWTRSGSRTAQSNRVVLLSTSVAGASSVLLLVSVHLKSR